jgi:selenocysteine-specific elongation factor
VGEDIAGGTMKRHNVIIGTAGHVDHGKTCLIRALTGTETDRLKEEKKRGITIELGFADMPNDEGQHIGIIDVPGHGRFIRNMLSGIGGIDLVLLVIAADEGVMPQTVEHFEILKMLQIRKGIVALTKADLVEEEWLSLVKEDVADTVQGTFLEDAPIIAVSSYTGQNISELKSLILEMVKGTESRREDPSLLRIPVDRVFTMEGFGTVVTGTLVEGSIGIGSEIQIYPAGKLAKVRNIQVHGKSEDAAYAGQRTAVNLVNIKKDEIKRGDVLAAKGSLKNTMMLDVKIRMFDDAKRNLFNGSRLHFYYGSAEVLCKVVLLDEEFLKNGEEGYAQLRFEQEIAVKKGDRFIVRFYSPLETIGGGIVLDANPAKHKRFRKGVLSALAVKETGDDKEVLEQTIREIGNSPVHGKVLAAKLGKTKSEFDAEAKELVAKGRILEPAKDHYVHIDHIESAKEAALAVLSEFHEKNPISRGMQKGEFRKKLSDKLFLTDLKEVDLFFNVLKDMDILQAGSDLISLSSFKVEYQKEHVIMQQRLEKHYEDAGYEIPDIDEAVAEEDDKVLAKQMVEALAEDSRLIRLSYQYYMHRVHFDEAMKRFRNHMGQNKGITLAEFRDILGTSRKYAMLILEYLDEQKITALTDDVRVLI